MLNRRQFRDLWRFEDQDLGDSDSPLWVLEREAARRPSRWFECVRPLKLGTLEQKQQYWHWCHEHCRGQVLCYSSNEEEQKEWWGFTHQADIILWKLKWS